MIRLLRRAVLVLIIAAFSGAAPARAVQVGIADENVQVFSDQRFLDARFPVVRHSIPWNVLTHPDQTAELDRYLEAARFAKVRPLLTFNQTRGDDSRALPTPAMIGRQFRALRKRYPWVTEYAAWNEANYRPQRTANRPGLVVSYYRTMQRACPSCTILAAEVLDGRNMAAWVKTFERLARPTQGRRPRPIWGLHNYIDANRFRTSGTRALLKATKGSIWITESGGIVRRTSPTKTPLPEGPSHAKRATAWLFDKLVPLSSRIRRVYVYQWNAPPNASWDSALIDGAGGSRPALKVVLDALARSRGAAHAK